MSVAEIARSTEHSYAGVRTCVLRLSAQGANHDRFDVDAESLAWRVSRLTGNQVRPLIYGEEEISGAMADQRVLADIARDGVALAGDPAGFRSRLRSGIRAKSDHAAH